MYRVLLHYPGRTKFSFKKLTSGPICKTFVILLKLKIWQSCPSGRKHTFVRCNLTEFEQTIDKSHSFVFIIKCNYLYAYYSLKIQNFTEIMPFKKGINVTELGTYLPELVLIFIIFVCWNSEESDKFVFRERSNF